MAINAGDAAMRSGNRASVVRKLKSPDSVPATRGANSLEALRPLIVCPACREEDVCIDATGNALQCPKCSVRFPTFRSGTSDVPWLFAEPSTTRLEWKARYNGFLHANASEQERLRKALGENRNSIAGRRRINRLLKGRKAHREQVTQLIAPLGLRDIDWPADATGLLHNKLPKSQGLSNYSTNIFRDWAWENGENEAMFSALDGVLSAESKECIGSVLTLGAGACRLSYDIHRRYSPSVSVVADINPLLLQIANEVISGKTFSLYEFPVAPLNEASFAVPQKCRAPASLQQDGCDKFHFVLADALNPPFAARSFDTVVTPWLIDIIPQDLREFMPRVNQILPKGGIWANTGSLAFYHQQASWCYSEEEVLGLVEENGFELIAVERQTIPYLQSPLSAHGRLESVLSFSARKFEEASVPAEYSYLPDWIVDTSQPVPSSADVVVSSSSHLLSAQVLATIDGKRTIGQIARAVASQYGLGTQETIHAVKRILVDAWEDNCFAEPGGDI